MPDAWVTNLLDVGMPAGTGDKDFVDSKLAGRTPTAMITSTGASSPGLAMSIGACDGTNEFLIACSAEDNVNRPDTKQYRNTAACFGQIDHDAGGGGVTLNMLASFVTFIPNGVRLNFSIADSVVSQWIHILFFGGDDMGIEVGNFAASAAAASTDTLNFGGAISSWSALMAFRTPNMNTGNDGGFAQGVVSRSGGNSTGQCIHYSSQDNTPAAVCSYGTFDDEFLRIVDHSSSDAWAISRTGAADTSITFTKNENDFTASHLFDYIAIDSPFQVKANMITTPTSVADWDVTDVGFKAEGLFGFGSAHLVADRNTTQTGTVGTNLGVCFWSDLGHFDESHTLGNDDDTADPAATSDGNSGGMIECKQGAEILFSSKFRVGGLGNDFHTRKFTPTGWHVDESEIFAARDGGSFAYCAFQGSGNDHDLVGNLGEQVRRRRRNPLLRM